MKYNFLDVVVDGGLTIITIFIFRKVMLAKSNRNSKKKTLILIFKANLKLVFYKSGLMQCAAVSTNRS